MFSERFGIVKALDYRVAVAGVSKVFHAKDLTCTISNGIMGDLEKKVSNRCNEEKQRRILTSWVLVLLLVVVVDEDVDGSTEGAISEW